MIRGRFVVAWLTVAAATPLQAQPVEEQTAVQAEVDVTAGYSTERVRALASQARLFGEMKGGFRFFMEATWTTTGGAAEDSDAFGSAYPYDVDRPRAMEAYVEKMARTTNLLTAVRVGRFRTPFGIYGRSDHAYGGFLRAPLLRYDNYFGVSNNLLEGGVDVVFGRPDVNVEISLGVPQDPIADRRRRGLDWTVRTQAYRGSLIVGASYIRTRPSAARSFARGDTWFTGVDVRWMRSGVGLRGEWMTGVPFDGATTTGWYIDATVHRPGMGPVTAVARAERLVYAGRRRDFVPSRVTTGARVVITPALVGHVNLVHQRGLPDIDQRYALDLALTYSLRLGLPR